MKVRLRPGRKSPLHHARKGGGLARQNKRPARTFARQSGKSNPALSRRFFHHAITARLEAFYP